MSTNPRQSRYALFPQASPPDEQGRRPAIRRYSLTRLTHGAARQDGAGEPKHPRA